MAKTKIKIMLVEDDQMIIDMYKYRLEEENYEVVVLAVGQGVVEKAQKEKPAVILLDVVLPDVDGFSILHSLKDNKTTKKIPVLLLTNLGQESDKERGIALGAVDYFVKAQHTPADILAKVKSIIK